MVYSSHLYCIVINTSFNFVIDKFLYKLIAHFSNNSLMSSAMLISLFVYCKRTFHLVMETKTYLTYLQKIIGCHNSFKRNTCKSSIIAMDARNIINIVECLIQTMRYLCQWINILNNLFQNERHYFGTMWNAIAFTIIYFA